ncbi:tetrachloroethene dehalogenase [Dehalobacter sp. 14DCB1]|uniref:tetrachloroethene dehalogenase n=1 Tax=Dehalobacter sp. 14DCB1 TaxID=2070227 RepID=UPI0010476E9D|nr:tetrachloroethene dehalogenase [Dehalobacter sp. 14DCB1]TCX51696.1 tetrachloroethene dehalogenase [Dehalobacter sp. 14DCB1]
MKIFDVLIWMGIGILMLVIQYSIWKYLKLKGKNTVPLQLCAFCANFLFVFALAWGYSSFVEGEYQAVAMGFLFFGGAALIPAAITYRLINRPSKKKADNSETISA